MRRNLFLLVAVFTLFVFTAFAMAQTPGGTTGASQNSSTSNSNSATQQATDSSQPVSGAATSPYSVNSGPNGRAAESTPTSSGSEKTIDGCIVKEQTDYFIQPASGDREKLSGSDVSAHVGHHVTLHGTDAANSTSSNSSAGTGSAETQNNAAGSMAGNAGSSNATGTASNSSNASSKEFNVTKVDMVSESCPADIQSKIDQNKSH